LSVYVPSPIPGGIPTGGIFHEADLRSGGGDAQELSPDSIAVDVYSLLPGAGASSDVMLVPRGGRSSLAGPLAMVSTAR
jgi:hypothetical protein